MKIQAKIYTLIFCLPLFLLSCESNGAESDAYGNFEAIEVMVSAESNGKLIRFEVEEGSQIKAGVIVGLTDTSQLHLQKEQVKASIGALGSKTRNVSSQINVLLERKNNLNREKRRVETLLKEDAATQKQLDDINGELIVVDKQIVATRTQIQNGNRGVLSEIRPMEAKIEQVNDQMTKSIIMNPVNGTVIAKYAEAHEIAVFGKPLYKIANLESLFLRIYVSGKQLPGIALGQEVEVLVDGQGEAMNALKGQISWISPKAEFTPKIIQTREERVNLVYAVKVRVKNDGSLKIGMPGEVNFSAAQAKVEAKAAE